MTPHSPEAVAAYPYRPNTVQTQILRTTYDRGRTDALAVRAATIPTDRERLANERADKWLDRTQELLTIYPEKIAAAYAWALSMESTDIPKSMSDWLLDSSTFDPRPGVLPSTGLVAGREAVARVLHKTACGCRDWFPGDPDDPQYDQQADALFASGTIADRSDVEAGALEAVCESCGEKIVRNPQWFHDGNREVLCDREFSGAFEASPTRLRSGKAEA